MREYIRCLSMVVSHDSPFRALASQLSLNNVHLWNFGAPYLNIDNCLIAIGPEVFENERLELRILERIFELSEKSVRNVIIYVNAYNLQYGLRSSRP